MKRVVESKKTQTAVYEAPPIVATAEMAKNAADSYRLPVLVSAVMANLSQRADQVPATNKSSAAGSHPSVSLSAKHSASQTLAPRQ